RLGRRHMFGAIVSVEPAHWHLGTAISLSQRGTVRLWIRRKKSIFPKQVSRWRLPCLETGRSAPASSIGRVLVMPHPRIPAAVAADPVGGHGCCGAENKH